MTGSAHDDGGQRPTCGPGCACAVGNEFGERAARHDLEAYHQSGPDRTTRWLLDGLRGGGAAEASGGDPPSIDGLTVLDIGAGVGAVHLELLRSGAAAAVDVDGSPAYVDVARGEAVQLGLADRVTYLGGDFVALAPTIAPADLVALDRVICCYPDMRALVRLSVARTRRRYGLVYPRDRSWIKLGGAVLNGLSRIARRRLRFHVHRTADVDAIVRAAGFTLLVSRTTWFWQVVVYERA